MTKSYSHSSRNVTIAGTVVALHIAVLWAFQSGLLQRAAEVVIPAEILAEFLTPPAPPAPPAPPVPPPPKPAPPKPTPTPPKPTPAPLPKPVVQSSIPTPDPIEVAPAPPSPPAPPAPPQPPAPPAPPSPPPPPVVVMPSSDAAYLNNPKPNYPNMSRRLGEKGRVMIRVYVGTDGQPKDGQIQKSSGYERLDQAALRAVMGWRFTPGTSNGSPSPMWVNIPVNFEME